uniref:Uncharacterized protein n=1 Tax=Actinobacteria phage HS02 TaxID=3056388 RepID=A0AA49X7S2_9VIRU|nr:MAG: hypothetical protein [Actinobacteria phage HS02]
MEFSPTSRRGSASLPTGTGTGVSQRFDTVTEPQWGSGWSETLYENSIMKSAG